MPRSICPICRNEIIGELCGYHTQSNQEAQWHITNKIWCGIIHRGEPFPKRVEIGLEDLTN